MRVQSERGLPAPAEQKEQGRRGKQEGITSSLPACTSSHWQWQCPGRGGAGVNQPPLQNLPGPSFFHRAHLYIFFGNAELCKNSFKHPQGEVPTLNGNSGAPPSSSSLAGRRPGLGPGGPDPPSPAPSHTSALRPRRPSPEQHLDLQIFPRSKIMARRWLRSPRIRNTFMVPRAAPRRAQPTPEKLSGGREAAATSPRRAVRPAPRAPRSPPPPPAHSRPGGDVARAAAVPGEPGSAAARDPASLPSQRLGPRGGAAGPGRGASGSRCPPPPPRAPCRLCRPSRSRGASRT